MKNRENTAYLALFGGFAKTVDLTILRDLQKVPIIYKDNNDNDNRTKQQQL